MNTNHSKYFELNPEEAIKKFFKKLYIVRYIAIFFLVLLLCFYLYGLFKFEDESIQSAMMLICGIVMLIVVLITFFLIHFLPYLESRQLQMVLYMDCAPVKMLDIIRLWEKKDRLGKAKNTFLLFKTQCCIYIPERLEEGLTYLQQINFRQKLLDREAIRLLLFAQYSRKQGDRESFDKVKTDMEQLPTLYPGNKFQKKSWEQAMRLLELEELIWDERTEEARTLLYTLLEKEPYQLSKVMFHMQLAQLDIEAEEYANAKQHLEYVIAHGNQLASVSKAKEQLEALQQ